MGAIGWLRQLLQRVSDPLIPFLRARPAFVGNDRSLQGNTMTPDTERGTGADVVAPTLGDRAHGPSANPAPGIRARIAYFGPDLDDPAVERRVGQWRHAGFEVLALAFSRGHGSAAQRQDVIDLGRILHQSRVRRILPLVIATLKLVAKRRFFDRIDTFIARNLDNLFLAAFARWLTGAPVPLVYEVLDINPSFTQAGWHASVLRRIEKWMLARTDLLVVSSPHFISEYYEAMLDFRGEWLLFENKVPKYARLERPTPPPAAAPPSSGPKATPAKPRWRIGWFGYLDDQRSWEALRRLARQLPDQVFIYIRGRPYASFDFDHFLTDVAQLENVVFAGSFKNPEDLADIYSAVDIAWSVDLNAPAGNSKWLLTNGIYEAGYFGKPVIGPANTAVGKFLQEHNSGWSLQEPIDEHLIELVRGLTMAEYERKCRQIREVGMDAFVERDEIDAIWTRTQRRKFHTQLESAQESVTTTSSALQAFRPKLLFMGFFPPPVDGQRVITQRVFERLVEEATIRRFDIDQFPRLGVLSKLLSAVAACFIVVAARARGYSQLYLAPHSGAGLLLSCIIVLVGRCMRLGLTIHYHSYRNIGQHSWLMSTFLAICGPRAIHIVLAPPMSQDLQRLYRTARRVAVVSNSAFVEPRDITRTLAPRPLRVGHLSNLSLEKGIATVIECMRQLRARGLDAELWLAGPAENADTAELVATAQAELGARLRYLGRLSAADVHRFYEHIDVFLFPTFYTHEAEPLVVIDALSAGVPVIATDRGCIGYMLGDAGGRAIAASVFVEAAVDQMVTWANDPNALTVASRAALARFMQMHEGSRRHLDRLIAAMLGRPADVAAAVRANSDTAITGAEPNPLGSAPANTDGVAAIHEGAQ